ncbi:hypothetical protein ACN47E_008457 [Coniothyrium glycines]
MHLQTDPSLAEAPGFSKEQLDVLARSVESRRQRLEADIRAYIKAKQDDLRSYERQLVEHHRSMECVENTASAEANPAASAQSPLTPHEPHPCPSPVADVREPQEKPKRQKHTRVHKREKELYGLVTPVFLPLLDARETSPTSQKVSRDKKQAILERIEDSNSATDAEQAAALRHAEKSKECRKSKKETKDMEGLVSTEAGKQNPHIEAAKKSKRSGVKKSALRHKDTPRSRRKRVSLVIDGQTVLPADTVIEPSLTSPSSEATSASNSTASLDELIDPRLTRPTSDHNAEHHSLPLPMSTTHSPTKPLAGTPSSLVFEAEHSLPLAAPRSPSMPFVPSSTSTRTFLDPSPSQLQPASIPRTAGPDPIYPYSPPIDLLESAELAANDDAEAPSSSNWGTYVGGLHGSGVDDVDQAGSYGYPSSLGASYLESYMQSRPLSVRMQAADKAGLDERETREMLVGRRREQGADAIAHGNEADIAEEDGFDKRGTADAEDDEDRDEDEDMDMDMDITGSMEF